MSKRTSKRKRRSKALPTLGFAGVSLSMASGACASVSEASANAPTNAAATSQSQSHELFLGEEELSDVSLATFYVFDKENAGPPPLDQHLRLARGCGGGGCGCGCGGGGHACGGGGCGCGGGGACRAGGGPCAGGGACASGIHPGGGMACASGMRPGGGMACASGIRPGIGIVHPGGAWGGHPGFAGRCRCGGRFFFRGCGCGGCGWGCGGCWGSCWIWDPVWGWVNTCWSESKPPAEVSRVASEQSAQTPEIAGKDDGSIVAKR
jgi:hypothetical protein